MRKAAELSLVSMPPPRSSDDEEVVKSGLGVIALYKGLLYLGRLLAESDLRELRELGKRLD